MKKFIDAVIRNIWILVLALILALGGLTLLIGASFEEVATTSKGLSSKASSEEESSELPVSSGDDLDDFLNGSGAFGDWEDFSSFYVESNPVPPPASRPSSQTSSEPSSAPEESSELPEPSETPSETPSEPGPDASSEPGESSETPGEPSEPDAPGGPEESTPESVVDSGAGGPEGAPSISTEDETPAGE